ncbi:hypothetical protein EVAR_89259_1 [Eumeta japonica]|uniref:Uncharacterized protein n=1 Tax=Eumeta variegata TaxID=151549 RepID=A0A4C1VL66_EUMVA|nr:hypothetical protein EVAR_89259_1 [Eumeta japonica]
MTSRIGIYCTYLIFCLFDFGRTANNVIKIVDAEISNRTEEEKLSDDKETKPCVPNSEIRNHENNETDVITGTDIDGVDDTLIYKDDLSDNVTTPEPEVVKTQKKKCPSHTNLTVEEYKEVDKPNKLNSIYLNNIYSSGAADLIEDKLSVDKLETNGVDLFDIVDSECGDSKKCPDFGRNWTTDKVITIGFLSAYGRSQVRS